MNLEPAFSCSHCGNALISDVTVPTSPVPHLLHNVGIALDLTEEAIIRKTIDDTEDDMLLVHQEMDQIDAILAGLIRRYDALGQYIQEHKNLLSPVRRLPVEILSEIFILSLPEPETNYGQYALRMFGNGDSKGYRPDMAHRRDDYGYSMRKAALSPGQVCRLWRKIAYSTPRLWSSIDLNILPLRHYRIQLRHNHSPETPLPFKLAAYWLIHSGTASLSLRITGFKSVYPEIHPLLRSLAACSRRWKHVSLDLELFQYDVLCDIKDNLPLLQSLALYHDNQRGYSWVETVFGSAPQLRSVCLNRTIDPYMITLPWAQLTHLSLLLYDIDNCLKALTLCVGLEECVITLSGYIIEPGRIDSLPHVSLNRLRSLKFVSDYGFNGFAEHLHAPALSDLVVDDRLTGQVTMQLRSLITRSSCYILSLTLNAGQITSDDLIVILRLLPLLRDFELEEFYSSAAGPDFLVRLTARDPRNSPDDILAPNLQSLYLANVPKLFDYEVLADMIQSRLLLHDSLYASASGYPKAQVVCIEKVWVAFRPNIDLNSLARLRGFRHDGLVINVPDVEEETPFQHY